MTRSKKYPIITRATYPNGSHHDRYLAEITWGNGKHGKKRRTREECRIMVEELGRLLDETSEDELLSQIAGAAREIVAIIERGHLEGGQRATALYHRSACLVQDVRDLLEIDRHSGDQS